jgi:hypothetical protein
MTQPDTFARLKARLMTSRFGPRIARLAPFLAIGPISGPLVAGVVFNFRGNRPFLATLYVILLGMFFLLLPVAGAWMLSNLSARP